LFCNWSFCSLFCLVKWLHVFLSLFPKQNLNHRNLKKHQKRINDQIVVKQH
jgi:hypothetical protein